MRLVTILALALLAAPAAAAAPARSVVAPGPVLAVSVEGGLVAYASGRSAYDCNRVYVWNLRTRGVSKLGRRTHCEQTSTGNSIASLALVGTRALWLHYVGGNQRTWTLWTATTAKPQPLRLRALTTDADAAAPIVVGRADGTAGLDVLPYAVGRTVVALRANGARRYAREAEAEVVGLAAHAGSLAVATRGGVVEVLDARGQPVRREAFAGEIDVVRLEGSALVVQRGRTLELRSPTAARTWALPARARLQDVAADKAVYVVGGQVRRLLLSSGAQRQLGLGSHAGADGARVAIAAKRRVTLAALR